MVARLGGHFRDPGRLRVHVLLEDLDEPGIDLERMRVESPVLPGRIFAEDGADVDPPRAGQDWVDEAEEMADLAVDLDVEDIDQRQALVVHGPWPSFVPARAHSGS